MARSSGWLREGWPIGVIGLALLLMVAVGADVAGPVTLHCTRPATCATPSPHHETILTAGVHTRPECQAQCEVETTLLGFFARRHPVGRVHEAELRVERDYDRVQSNVLLHTDTGPQYLRFWWHGEDTFEGGPHDEVRQMRAFLADDTRPALQVEFFNWHGAAFSACFGLVILGCIGLAGLATFDGRRWNKTLTRRKLVDAHARWVDDEARRAGDVAASEPASTGSAPLVQLRRVLQEPPSEASWRAVHAVLVGVAPGDTPPVQYAFDHMREDWSSWRRFVHPALDLPQELGTPRELLEYAHRDVIARIRTAPIDDDLMFCFHRLVETHGAVVEGAMVDLRTFSPPWIPASWLRDRSIAPGSLRSRLAARCPQSMSTGHAHAWILIEPCTFTMGSPRTELGRDDDETQHEVTLTRPFLVAAHPVLREGWAGQPNWAPDDDLQAPVSNISWIEAREHCDAAGVRLLTEAEWECVCRAGTHTATYGGDLDEDPEYRAATLLRVAQWTDGARRWGSDQRTANPWGLYGTLGHVAEWTADIYAPYPDGPVTDQRGRVGTDAVFRGGAWSTAWPALRAADRSHAPPTWRNVALGLRVARDLVPPWERLW